MKLQIEAALGHWSRAQAFPLLALSLVGLEKESLRVAVDGGISQAPHPAALGSALTHPWLTTDYSEALLEFITPPFDNSSDALGFLHRLQTYVQSKMEAELLWAGSMPCILKGEASIPIARYGHSNRGLMKHLYRVGLGHRYGRIMQVIAGIHFNFSFAPELWPIWGAASGHGALSASEQANIGYMAMLRNLQRFGWLVLYLFGASPAVCKSFFADKPNRLHIFDEGTYYGPWATSLRMGDIGYQNRREEGMGVKANYDSLADYVASLKRAIETPAPLWEEIGIKVNGEYRQLNANILQIENEYYSSVRPKQVLQGLEKPIHALSRRGIAYIELRSLDVSPFHALGVDEETLRFLHLLMCFALLYQSPGISRVERREIDHNLNLVAHRGREPGLRLECKGTDIGLQDWALQLLEALEPLCEIMGTEAGLYRETLALQRAKVEDAVRTPSARVLEEMRQHGEGFYEFFRRISLKHARFFQQQQLDSALAQELDALALASQAEQRALEASDSQDFDGFLKAYHEQLE